MIESRAYLSLSGFAPQLLTLVLGKRQFEKQGRKGKEKWVLVNGDSINITHTEFNRKYGITQPRLIRAIDQLLEKGFISVVHPGGLYRHDKAVFALSDSWILWKPGMIMQTRKKEQVKRGFCRPKKQNSHTKT
ncbi:MAG: hypothetical protein Q7J15_12775 [Candidatus Desulfaltia sp.]|nr:hypothetical protein [Candidatus Desulfaltia sp.]